MTSYPDQSALTNKLMEPVTKIVNQHGAQIAPILKGSSASLGQAALKNDETVRTVAIYCYALLPGVVRLAVKEPAFISFVMAHREKILGKLVAGDATVAG
jgi:hypothetical protein